MHLQAVCFRNGSPRTAEDDTIDARGKGRFGWWQFSRLHDPVCRAGCYFPDIYSQRLWRKECVEWRDSKLGGCVREVVAPDISVIPDFIQGCVKAFRPSSF